MDVTREAYDGLGGLRLLLLLLLLLGANLGWDGMGRDVL